MVTGGAALIVYAALLLIGLPFAKRGHYELMLVAIGGFTHIAIDCTTHVPRSVFWPFVTLPVSHNSTVVGATNIAGEFFGSILVLWYFARRYRESSVTELLQTGEL